MEVQNSQRAFPFRGKPSTIKPIEKQTSKIINPLPCLLTPTKNHSFPFDTANIWKKTTAQLLQMFHKRAEISQNADSSGFSTL